METTYTLWKQQQLEQIDQKTASYDEAQLKKAEIPYIKRLLEKMATHAKSQAALEDFQQQIETLIPLIPTKEKFEDKTARRPYCRKKSKIKNNAAIKHKLVHKGYYVSYWMPLGMAFGLPWGVTMGNIALGLPIGLAIGLAIGAGLDQKAAKEGRVV